MSSVKTSDRAAAATLQLFIAICFIAGVQLLSYEQSVRGQERNERHPSSYHTNHRDTARHKPVPVPLLGPALVGLGIGLIRKRKQISSPEK
jgi:hypothetical protein